jgi:hypothetical protein
MLRSLKKIWKALNNESISSSKWTTVLITSDIYFGSIVKNALEQAGIPVMIIDQRDSSYLNFGQIHLQVLPEHFFNAQKIVNSSDE